MIGQNVVEEFPAFVAMQTTVLLGSASITRERAASGDLWMQPSASFPFTWGLIERLEKNGIEILTITHATGMSNTGDPRIDAILPVTERSTCKARAATSG